MSTERDTPAKLLRSKEIKLASGRNPQQVATQRARWPKKDEIQWLLNRLAEQEDPTLYQKGVVPEAGDIKVWLARDASGFPWIDIADAVYGSEKAGQIKAKKSHACRVWHCLSWGEIAENLYSAKTLNQIDAGKSAARRAYKRVERYWTEGKTHLTGHQAYLRRQEKEWRERFFASDFFD